ncbi:MAG: AbrB/MazE/SpoVT family DNA-binding domain-containing protein [Polyangiaceae bacterium]|nr:AbrB/MazE/SpoVT family DNA-binding domain-containing protein [Polyangiaceae bacterium]
MKSVVSEKGQVTIPKSIRERLGLRAGTELEFRTLRGQLIGVKKSREDPIAKWRGKGCLPLGLSADEYLARVRGGS